MGGCCDKESREGEEGGSKVALLSHEHRGAANGPASPGGVETRTVGADKSIVVPAGEDPGHHRAAGNQRRDDGGSASSLAGRGPAPGQSTPQPVPPAAVAPTVKPAVVLDARKLAAIVEHAEDNFLDLDRSTLGVQRDDPEDHLDLLSRLRSVEVPPLAPSAAPVSKPSGSSSSSAAVPPPQAFKSAAVVATFSKRTTATNAAAGTR